MQAVNGRSFVSKLSGKSAITDYVQADMTDISKALEHLGSDPLSDEEIVRRVLTGDVGMFEPLIQRHDQPVTARTIARNETDAEDIAQETYLHAFQHLR